MYPRLIIISAISLTVLNGCKHRDSFTEFGAPSASVTHATITERPDPLHQLGNVLFGSRNDTVTQTTEETVVGEEDPIQYVDPVTPPYQASYKTEQPAEPVAISPSRRAPVEEVEEEEETLPAYELDTGDRIRIYVYDQPNLSRVYNVDGQGRISVPLIGSVLARGRTTRSLERTIKHGLQRKYVKDAKVSIEVAVYRPFFIHGEVRSPGQFPYVYGMTVEAAIATAGGFSPRARKTGIKIVRTIDGSRDVVVTNPSAYVRPGDIIMVDERFF